MFSRTGRLSFCLGYAQGALPFFARGDGIGGHKINGFYITEADTLRIPSAQITFEDLMR